MNNQIIANWNKKVTGKDKGYIVGVDINDFSSATLKELIENNNKFKNNHSLFYR